MADLLSTGVSGLLASQVGLSTVGHNISNVNTAGYTRQTTTFNARAPQYNGGYYVGQGADAISVQRAYSQFLTQSVWSASSGQSRASQYATLTASVNNAVSGSANLQTALDGFFGSVSDVANAPIDTASRQAMIGKANTLVATFKSLSSQFQQLDQQTNQQISAAVDSINSLAKSIADLNGQIQKGYAGGAVPNDLLDARDQAVSQLSQIVGVNVTQTSDHMYTVSVGNGQPLVNGTNATQLSTANNQYDSSRLEVVGPGGSVISSQLGSGSLGATFDFRTNVLDPARNQLGRAAIAMTDAFNKQSAQGIDLNGAAGGDFFNIADPAVFNSTANKGTGSVTATVADVSKLDASDYVMRFDGTNWSATTTAGVTVPMTGTGTAADPFVVGGLNVTVGAGAVAGDSFQIQPTRNAASTMSVAVSDTSKIAASGPLAATKGASNTGKGVLGNLTVTDVTNPAFNTPATITFTSPTTYSINGGAPQTYADGDTITGPGWTLKLTGSPAANDTFSVKPAGSASGDNGNALAMANVATKGVLDNGVTTVGKAYSQLIAQVGTAGAQANTALTAQQSILDQATASQQGLSGVNMDEEAANLLRFQQSYAAAAQVINTANTIFNSLLTAVQG
ncbi:flagellar hook-associated protein FlgK [Luteibacter rhizovicinus DSM 16549]|uniref:Flagellar hook-associated protein 1 n=1 Tax=Luteibacter rhizovicinus DSM 16549 TaxID=1440763 RepID=A0A0G9HF28_9GAMM|nr:flagellar hook-associated protein FlgK [Luteibacter rhizovicinus]APG02809.1 flagellar hook-associated protein FlgK [Luteibacter rhizovicinus DSM 16549]KLD68405.1 flagellar hook protein FlgK [Luteibacter rhizovicinus DSM 16549]